MKSIARLLNRLTELPMLLAAVTLFILMVLTFADVIMRSTFSAPIEAATELTRIAMAVIVFASLPVVSGRAEHIVVDLLDPIFLRAGIKRVLDGLIMLVCGVLLVWPAMRSCVLHHLVHRLHDAGHRDHDGAARHGHSLQARPSPRRT
jgi:TRAP-type transport system small permease protein